MSKKGTYGLNYQGSKNWSAERIVNLLPMAAHLYDLFAGGCAIAHCALLSGKWGKVHFSDVNSSVLLFRDVLEGNAPDGSEWISREEFYRRRDTDPYVRIIWSFGGNQKDYLYSREIEPYKKAVHEMIFAATPNERRMKFKEVIRLLPMGKLTLGGRNRESLSELAHGERSIRPPHLSDRLQSATNYQRLINVCSLRNESRFSGGGGETGI